MSRPPKPVRDLNQPMRRHGVYLRVCSSFGAWRSRSRDEQRAGKPDDVEVVALDPLDEAAAEALDRVRAGASLPLAARDVRARASSSASEPERDVGRARARRTSSPAPSRQTPETTVCVRPESSCEHPRAPRRASAGFAVDAAVEDDGRVDAERDAAFAVHGARLALGVPADELDGVGVRRVVLDVRRARRPRTGSAAARGSPAAAGDVEARTRDGVMPRKFLPSSDV